MKCPKCDSTDTIVTSTGNRDRGELDEAMGQYRRYRTCKACGKVFTTLEQTEGEVLRLRQLAHRAVMGGK